MKTMLKKIGLEKAGPKRTPVLTHAKISRDSDVKNVDKSLY